MLFYLDCSLLLFILIVDLALALTHKKKRVYRVRTISTMSYASEPLLFYLIFWPWSGRSYKNANKIVSGQADLRHLSERPAVFGQIFSSGGRRINGFVASAASGFMHDIRRLDEMTREAISHVYQSTCYLCCGGPVAEEASQQANFSCSLRGCVRMLNTNSTCIFTYYTHREGIYSLLL